MISGLLYVDKPAGISSHDVVGVVRRAARSRRVGHAGTLDPFATGLLVVAIGPCTRLLPYIVGEPKVYEATFSFGTETDTDDRTGTPLRTAATPPLAVLADPSSAVRLAAERQLTGRIEQVPPAYSAKHVDGQRAYELARRGREVVLEPVTIDVHRWEWLAGTDSAVTVRITCGGGTYIRALARDLGRLLDSAAHCSALRRIASGPAHVRDAVPYTALMPGAVADGSLPLRSPLEALGAVARESLDDTDLVDLRHGRPVRARHEGEWAAFLHAEQVIGMGRRNSNGRWQPTVVLLGADQASS